MNSFRDRPARYIKPGGHATFRSGPISRQTAVKCPGPQKHKTQNAAVRSQDHLEENFMADANLDGRLDETEDFEEITSDEVDRVVEQLEKMMETVSSENIKSYLEEAVNNIFFLLYDDDDNAEAA
jgi:hypothetical protein